MCQERFIDEIEVKADHARAPFFHTQRTRSHIQTRTWFADVHSRTSLSYKQVLTCQPSIVLFSTTFNTIIVSSSHSDGLYTSKRSSARGCDKLINFTIKREALQVT